MYTVSLQKDKTANSKKATGKIGDSSQVHVNENNSSSKNVTANNSLISRHRNCHGSPSNDTVYISASKFVCDQSQFKNSVEDRIQSGDSSDTGYDSGDQSNNSSPTDITSNKGMLDLISEIRKMSSLDDRGTTSCSSDRPSTSRGAAGLQNGSHRQQLSAEDIKCCIDVQFECARDEEIADMIKVAERGRADVFKPPGKIDNKIDNQPKTTWEIDEDFFQFGAHIDSAMTLKIEKGEYVNLAKLLPKHKILHSDR